MNAINKMGGFVSARIIPVSEIQIFQIKNARVHLTLKNSATLNDLPDIPYRKNGISANITPSTGKSGTLYEVDLQISLRKALSDPVKSTPYNKVIALFTDPMGATHVFGTAQFPLSLTKTYFFSPNRSGHSGIGYSITGKQPVPPALLG